MRLVAAYGAIDCITRFLKFQPIGRPGRMDIYLSGAARRIGGQWVSRGRSDAPKDSRGQTFFSGVRMPG